MSRGYVKDRRRTSPGEDCQPGTEPNHPRLADVRRRGERAGSGQAHAGAGTSDQRDLVGEVVVGFML